MHRFLRLSCIGLVEGTARDFSEMAMLASLAVRLLVALTDSTMWLSFKDGDSKARAKLVVHELLEWIAEGNTPLYPAVRACIIQICPFKQEDSGRSKQLQKETLLIMASAITVALRPLQQFSAEEDARGVNQRQVAARKKASDGFCSCVLTIPYVVHRLPAAIIPALQHPSVLTPCLQTFGVS